MEKEGLKVVVELKGKNFSNGQAITAFEADAVIVKETTDRVHQNDEDSITIRATDCGGPKIEANYHSKYIGEGEVKTNVNLDVKGKHFDPIKKDLVDGFSASGKIAKTDAGRPINKAVEDWFNVKASKDCGENCASAESFYSTKINEVIS